MIRAALQVTELEMSCVLWSLYVPTAVNWPECFGVNVVLWGDNAIETSTGAATVSASLPLMEPFVAVTVTYRSHFQSRDLHC